MTDFIKYDRQFRTYGIDATIKLLSSTVYIVGLKNGYAAEICKNLALSGIQKIVLIGTEIIDENDKNNCIFYKKSNIDDICWLAIKKHIQEINNSIISIVTDSNRLLFFRCNNYFLII